MSIFFNVTSFTVCNDYNNSKNETEKEKVTENGMK